MDIFPLAVLASEDVHAVPLLVAAAVLLCGGVLPDVLPQVQAEGLKGRPLEEGV
jgi:hypothetical protein